MSGRPQRRALASAVATAALLTLVLPAAAHATTYTVTSTADGAPPASTGTMPVATAAGCET